ncbi:serine/threonine-protein kinase [Lacipirellula limnantheis]|uniref:Serine/threonine-protein kinase PknB n=1 Tax=Lacipirellula limnantheis TaxID=2528024 RepID=A0A517TXN6_9BACT|nr:serine/threonine-protein kinase [Lacipirellula limnantheis]QDT73142.1 Serine/threonine-protein kinase PknB [Lacipirellula limnantheis]
MIGPGSESEAPSKPAVETLVAYDQAKGRDESSPALPSGMCISDGEAIACVDLLHRVWPPAAAFAPAPLAAAAVLGDFRIVREIGRGGMGVVYEAEQMSLRRRVALKVLPQAAFLDEGRLARFELEARAAATLDHPNIVPIYSIGCEQNVHYYAMQWIRGVSLAELYAERTSAAGKAGAASVATTGAAVPPPHMAETDAAQHSFGASRSHAERYFDRVADWGRQAAEALHFSHERGVIHRDVKPANLIIDPAGKLWITDFGLARLQDDAGVTCTGDLVGTLQYASPERLQGNPAANHLVDVYALGITLYEMLALKPAFEGNDRPAVIRQIMERDPRPLRQVDPWIATDLEIIVAKATEKEPSNRYQSAGEFADDLRRFLNDQPIKAKRPTIADRALKWARRHQALAKASLVFGGALILLLGASVMLIQRSLRDTADLLYMADLNAAYSAWGQGSSEEAREILGRHTPAAWQADRRGLEWRVLHDSVAPPDHLELLGHVGPVNEIAVFPDRRRLASVGADGTLRLWDLPSGKLLRTVTVCNEPLNSVAVSGDGKWAAVESNVAYLCDLEDGAEISEVLTSDFTFESLAFSPDGESLFAGSRYHEVVKLSLEERSSTTLPSAARIESLEVSPNGALLVPNRRPGYADAAVGVIQFVDPGSMQPTRELDASLDARHRGQLTVARSSACGEYILAGEKYDSTAYLFESKSGKIAAQTPVSRDRLTDVAIAADGTSIGIGYRDGVVEVFLVQLQRGDAVINSRPRIIHAHDGELLSLQFVDATRLATAGADGAIRLWDLSRNQATPLECGEASLTGVVLSPDGKYVAYTSLHGYGAVNADDGSTTLRRRHPGRAFQYPVWAPQSDEFSIVARDDAAVVTVRPSDAQARTIKLRERPEKFAYSPRGDELALVGAAHLSIVDSKTGAETFHSTLEAADASSVCYSTDGKWLALGDEAGVVTVVKRSSARTTAQFKARGEVDWVCFSPDGRLLASGHRDGVLRLWDLRTETLAAEFGGHEVGVADALFSRDGNTLVSSSQSGAVRIWSVKHARLFGVLFDPAWEGTSVGPCRLALTESGHRLAIGYQNVLDDFPDMLLWQAK